MFISSYFPLYIILLILNFDIKKSKVLFVKNNVFLIILIIFCGISIITVINLKHTKGNENHIFSDIEKTEDTIISYLMTYIVPILSINISNTDTIIINCILYVLIGFMYIKLNLIYLNPLFLICGYYVYKAKDEMVIITDIPYIKLKNLSGDRLKSSRLGNDIYLVQKNDNINRL
jgi:hypothetical protein